MARRTSMLTWSFRFLLLTLMSPTILVTHILLPTLLPSTIITSSDAPVTVSATPVFHTNNDRNTQVDGGQVVLVDGREPGEKSPYGGEEEVPMMEVQPKPTKIIMGDLPIGAVRPEKTHDIDDISSPQVATPERKTDIGSVKSESKEESFLDHTTNRNHKKRSRHHHNRHDNNKPIGRQLHRYHNSHRGDHHTDEVEEHHHSAVPTRPNGLTQVSAENSIQEIPKESFVEIRKITQANTQRLQNVSHVVEKEIDKNRSHEVETESCQEAEQDSFLDLNDESPPFAKKEATVGKKSESKYIDKKLADYMGLTDQADGGSLPAESFINIASKVTPKTGFPKSPSSSTMPSVRGLLPNMAITVQDAKVLEKTGPKSVLTNVNTNANSPLPSGSLFANAQSFLRVAGSFLQRADSKEGDKEQVKEADKEKKDENKQTKDKEVKSEVDNQKEKQETQSKQEEKKETEQTKQGEKKKDTEKASEAEDKGKDDTDLGDVKMPKEAISEGGAGFMSTTAISGIIFGALLVLCLVLYMMLVPSPAAAEAADTGAAVNGGAQQSGAGGDV